MVANYRWSFFIRAWIEIYLEVIVAAYLQVLHPAFDNVLLSFNSILGYIFFVGLLFTPVIVLIFLVVNSERI